MARRTKAEAVAEVPTADEVNAAAIAKLQRAEAIARLPTAERLQSYIAEWVHPQLNDAYGLTDRAAIEAIRQAVQRLTQVVEAILEQRAP